MTIPSKAALAAIVGVLAWPGVGLAQNRLLQEQKQIVAGGKPTEEVNRDATKAPQQGEFLRGPAIDQKLKGPEGEYRLPPLLERGPGEGEVAPHPQPQPPREEKPAPGRDKPIVPVKISTPLRCGLADTVRKQAEGALVLERDAFSAEMGRIVLEEAYKEVSYSYSKSSESMHLASESSRIAAVLYSRATVESTVSTKDGLVAAVRFNVADASGHECPDQAGGCNSVLANPVLEGIEPDAKSDESAGYYVDSTGKAEYTSLASWGDPTAGGALSKVEFTVFDGEIRDANLKGERRKFTFTKSEDRDVFEVMEAFQQKGLLKCEAFAGAVRGALKRHVTRKSDTESTEASAAGGKSATFGGELNEELRRLGLQLYKRAAAGESASRTTSPDDDSNGNNGRGQRDFDDPSAGGQNFNDSTTPGPYPGAPASPPPGRK